jgi:DUF2075 family protein/DNA replication protein DnaC
MSNIYKFKYDSSEFANMKKLGFSNNWPVVYLIEDGKEMYIGQTTSIYSRSRQHYNTPERQRLENIHILHDEEYNLSAAYDIESLLIQYMAADGVFRLQNSNHGLKGHNYFDREKYQAKFEDVWQELIKLGLAQRETLEIKNSDLFKYSPYKSLSSDQKFIADRIYDELVHNYAGSLIINGGPGTGKTILATYLVKFLSEDPKTSHLKIGLVVPMTSLRQTLKNVFKYIKGLKASMILGPADVIKDKYDLLIVDESHRLKRRKNLTNFPSFDNVNKYLNLDSDSDELDWIRASSKVQIFFYDKNQSVRPSDVRPEKFDELFAEELFLESQMRVGEGLIGGQNYIEFVNKLFDNDLQNVNLDFRGYSFKLYDDLSRMVSDIKKLDNDYALCRIVSGYAWPWISKTKPDEHDIVIGETKLKWNSTNSNWVNSKNAINEINCIHTVQGYDLNYAGVIIGPELGYDLSKKEFIIRSENYKDFNGRRGIDNPEELKGYILNIYKTLLTRSIKGTYVYIVDDGLRKYFEEALSVQYREAIKI